MTGIIKTIKDLLTFQESKPIEQFVLRDDKDKEKLYQQPIKNSTQNAGRMSQKGTRRYPKKVSEIQENKDNKKQQQGSKISSDIKKNIDYMKRAYHIPTNGDIILREFKITIKEKTVSAFIVFYDGMVDRKVINGAILQPLMLLSNLDIKDDPKDIITYVSNRILPQNQIKLVSNYQQVIDEVNFGGCGIFVDGAETVITADVKGWEHRSVDSPKTEMVIRGPQESFTEVLRINTALVRKALKNKDLIAEDIAIGRHSKTPCSLMYIKGTANEELVQEVRRRLKSVMIDNILDSSQLEQLIEDSTFIPMPQMLLTERPDRVISALAEGRVAVIMNGSPFALVMPVTFFMNMHSPEDYYMRFPYATFIRLIRFVGALTALLLPGMYIAIINYHPEMIPTDLLLAIVATREKVPFPSVVEIFIMGFAFELIQEAGIRIPSPIGPTLSIVGALILGQAAVAASIVSPILIIIIAITAIGTFAVPEYSIRLSFRLFRFIFVVLGVAAGFLGITVGVFIYGLAIVNVKSFGVPYFAPYAPKTRGALMDTILLAPIWGQEQRLDFLNAEDEDKHGVIRKGWIKRNRKG